mmetsp:Transcript_17456/g.43935  ORF Transcript_17456/g.43935 Transcript_17456/m.43935 type:complete len:287 (-) Transcript_17456:371-1231(-)
MLRVNGICVVSTQGLDPVRAHLPEDAHRLGRVVRLPQAHAQVVRAVDGVLVLRPLASHVPVIHRLPVWQGLGVLALAVQTQADVLASRHSGLRLRTLSPLLLVDKAGRQLPESSLPISCKAQGHAQVLLRLPRCRTRLVPHCVCSRLCPFCQLAPDRHQLRPALCLLQALRLLGQGIAQHAVLPRHQPGPVHHCGQQRQRVLIPLLPHHLANQREQLGDSQLGALVAHPRRLHLHVEHAAVGGCCCVPVAQLLLAVAHPQQGHAHLLPWPRAGGLPDGQRLLMQGQ